MRRSADRLMFTRDPQACLPPMFSRDPQGSAPTTSRPHRLGSSMPALRLGMPPPPKLSR